jgi:hypothetical protein
MSQPAPPGTRVTGRVRWKTPQEAGTILLYVQPLVSGTSLPCILVSVDGEDVILNVVGRLQTVPPAGSPFKLHSLALAEVAEGANT